MVMLNSILRRHGRWTPILDRVADGSSTAAEQAAFATHKQSCAACTQTFATTLALRSALTALPPIAAPRSFRIDERMLATRVADDAAARVTPAASRPVRAIRLAQVTTGIAALALAALVAANFTGGDEAADSSTATSSLEAAEARVADAPVDQSTKSSPAFGAAAGSGASSPGGALAIPTSVRSGGSGAAATSPAVPPQATVAARPSSIAGSSGPDSSDSVDAASTDPEPPTLFPTPAPPSTGVGDAAAGGMPLPLPQPMNGQGTSAYAVPGSAESNARDASAEPPRTEIGAPSVIADGDQDNGGNGLLIAEVVAGLLLAAALTTWIALSFNPRRS